MGYTAIYEHEKITREGKGNRIVAEGPGPAPGPRQDPEPSDWRAGKIKSAKNSGHYLLWRKAGVYGPDTKSFLIGLHNWEIAAKYIGVILAAGLIFMVVTGSLIFFKLISRKH